MLSGVNQQHIGYQWGVRRFRLTTMSEVAVESFLSPFDISLRAPRADEMLSMPDDPLSAFFVKVEPGTF